MLLIPDIHINTQYRDQIISKLSDIVTHHSNEKHIVLLGDYVYMFSYDRDALLALYKLLIGRYHEGKTIYVLAGNHDWHGQHFVYEEARQARDIINQPSLEQHNHGAIHFITTPQVYQIEGESVLMMPYMIDWSQHTNLEITNPLPHHSLYTALTQSTNKYEQASGWLNLTIEHYTQNHKIDTIIHHYYTANTQFPGLRTQFSYRDVALDPYWVTAGYDVISGHIHHPFCYGRYLCCGSLRNTAANETNQFKYYRIKHDTNIQGYQLQINPHLTIAYHDTTITEADIHHHRNGISNTQQIQSSHYYIQLHHEPLLINQATIVISSTKHEYTSSMIDEALSQQARTIKSKYQTIIAETDTIAIDTEKLQTSIINRKSTLAQYITAKYPENYNSYLTILDDLNILDKK